MLPAILLRGMSNRLIASVCIIGFFNFCCRKMSYRVYKNRGRVILSSGLNSRQIADFLWEQTPLATKENFKIFHNIEGERLSVRKIEEGRDIPMGKQKHFQTAFRGISALAKSKWFLSIKPEKVK